MPLVAGRGLAEVATMGSLKTMAKESRFVHGGGWVRTVETGRPITGWLTFAAAISCVPALCGLLLAADFDSPSLWQGMLTFPSWALLLPTPLLIILSVIAYFVEPPRTVNREQPNPSYDPHNLY